MGLVAASNPDFLVLTDEWTATLVKIVWWSWMVRGVGGSND